MRIVVPFLILMLISGTVVSQCVNNISKIVSWWDADNVNISTASDIRGGLNASFKNGSYSDSGFVCNAFYFDGVDDHLFIPDNCMTSA